MIWSLSGHDVQDIVESNTFQGLQAKLKFNEPGKRYNEEIKVKKRNGSC